LTPAVLPPARASAGQEQTMTADLTALLSLIDEFYRETFTLAKGQERFGPVAADKEDVMLLSPPAASGLAAVTLEKLQTESSPPPFLAGISIKYKEPVLVDFAALAQRFGPEVELPRLKPRQNIPYRFLIQGTDYSGYMICQVPPGGDAAAVLRKVNNLILRRFPPAQT
jgi:hypothetical protein